MTDVSKLLLTRFGEDKINLSWCIVQTHVDIVGLPEGLIRCRESNVSLGVTAASVIAEPHIVPCVNQGERRSQVSTIRDPKVHVAKQTRLHQDSGLLDRLTELGEFAGETVDLGNVAIFSHNCVALRDVAIL